jgi:hypothetical protein
VLAVIGVAMILTGFFVLYPRRAEILPPYGPTVYILVKPVTCPLHAIYFRVDPDAADRGVYRLKFSLETQASVLPGGRPCARDAKVSITMNQISGTTFMDCNPCPPSGQTVSLLIPPGGIKDANFPVKGIRPAVVSNGLTTYAALPQVLYIGVGKPTFFVYYNDIPSAETLNWSGDTPFLTLGSEAGWSNILVNSQSAQVATGTNEAAQASDAFKNFLAGAIIALGGAAFLAAVIEAVHTRDWDRIRELRSK